MTRIPLGWQVLALACIAVCLGALPWLQWADHFPHGVDPSKWVRESHHQTRGWMEWAFRQRHFIGYRPVTALSFTLDSLVSGWEPWAYRLTDVVLHLSVGIAAFALYRVWARDPSPWSLLVPCVVFLHPASEDVVPHLARRSYSLAVVLGLLGLLASTAALRDDRPWRRRALTLVACGFTAMALLSNEVAYVPVVVLVLFAVAEGYQAGTVRRGLLHLAAIAATTLSALGARYAVLGHFGGYHKRYFAHTIRGRNVLKELETWQPLEVFEASMRYALFPSSGSGKDALLWGPGVLPMASVAIVLAGLVWWVVGRSWGGRRQVGGFLPAVLGAWLVGYALLYAISGAWFWRQGYPMLVPLSLLLTLGLRGATQAEAERAWARWALRAVAWVPGALLLLSIAWHAPPIRGMDEAAYRGDQKANDLIHRLRADLSTLTGQRGTVWAVVPIKDAQRHDVSKWVRRGLPEGANPELVFLASTENHRVRLGERLVELYRSPSGRVRVQLHPQLVYTERLVGALGRVPEDGFWLDELARGASTGSWLYTWDDEGTLLLDVAGGGAEVRGRSSGRRGR